MIQRVLTIRANRTRRQTGTRDLPLRRQEPDTLEALVERFSDTVTRLSELNGRDPAWWYTWLSCRDRNNARLFDLWHRLTEVETALASQSGWHHITCHEPEFAQVVAERARRLGWRVTLPFVDRLAWLARRMSTPIKEMADAARILRHGLGLWKARSPRPAGKRDVVLVTIFHERASPAGDVYFGPLPEMLAAQGETVLVTGQVLGCPRRVSHRLQGEGPVARATLGSYLSPADAFRAAVWAWWNGPALDAQAPLLRLGLGRKVIDLGTGHLMQAAMTRILADNPKARVIHMYENNPWERAVDRTAHEAGRAVFGFLHCSVLPFHLKNRFTQADARLRPAPDRIICTGPAARNVLLGLGDYDPDRVVVGSDLRGTAPSTALAIREAAPEKISTVLILLEGLAKMVGLMRFAHRAALINPHIRFLVRAHPAWPAESLAALAGIPFGAGAPLSSSTALSLEGALEEADMVIYQGSTAAMTAGWMGIPLARFDAGEFPTDDPLFQCPFLKYELKRPEDLTSAATFFVGMLQDEYVRHRDGMRDYVRSYLAPVQPDDVAAFCCQRSSLT